MSLLSDSDIASMRTTLDESLPDTAVVQSGTVVSDSGGGGTLTWAAAGTVACRLAPISGSERDIAGRLTEQAKWIVTLPAETPVTTGSRIVIGSTSYEVLALRAPRSYELSRRVECGEVV